jgi:hypothetical protein
MSNSTAPIDRLPDPTDLLDAEVVRSAITAPVRFIAFWVAVALPFLYVPLLFVGLGGERTAAFVGLLLVNAVALVVGHDHAR